MDPLALLERPDKWFLGGGRTLIYAPPFPQYLQTPGLWDDAHLLDFAHPRPFTWTLLDEQDREIPLRWESHSWRPDGMTRTWSTTDGLSITEQTGCLRENTLVAELRCDNTKGKDRKLTLVMWTVQQHDDSYDNEGNDCLWDIWFPTVSGRRYFRRTTPLRRGRVLPYVIFDVELYADAKITSSCEVLSQLNSLQPDWRLTPFFGSVKNGLLPDIGVPEDVAGYVYMATTYDFRIGASESSQITLAASIGTYTSQQTYDLKGNKPISISSDHVQREWQEWFAGVPDFQCSDSYLTNAYWYRWYGLRLNAIEPPGEDPIHRDLGSGQVPPATYKHPAVCEGIEYFRDLVSYSAQVHMRELRWMHDPTFARGSLRNFLDHQKPDGNFPGNIYATFVHNDDMYHADWGRSLLAVNEIHPDGAFLEEAYAPLCRYARFFLDTRDPDGSHLYDVVNQWETGQEYMHRYTAVDPHADGGNELQPHLKGVDATLYMFNLFTALAEIAALLERPEEAEEWATHAAATEEAMRSLMWDAEAGMFSDVNAATMARTGVRAAVDFYPFLTLDLGTEDYLGAFREHLLNPEEFWTPFPVPAEAANDPEFSAEPFWRGERKNCPWNGRVWPMTNSHVCEALARTAQEYAPDLEPYAAEMLRTFVRMMTVDGDPARPNSYEHYNPLNGTASYYRGIDDYQHSYLVDLIIRFVAGVQPRADGTVIVNPLPMGLDWFELKDAPYQGHRIGVRWDVTAGLSVSVDGEDVAYSPILDPLGIPIVDESAW